MWAIASISRPQTFRRQLFGQLVRIFGLVLILGVPAFLLTAPPPVEFVDLMLHRDAYRAALGWPQLLPSPARISVVETDPAVPPGVTRQIRRFPRVYALRWPDGKGRQVLVQARMPRGYYQMSGSSMARLRILLSFLLFYLLLLIFSTRLVGRLSGRLLQLRQVARRLAQGDLSAQLSRQKEDSAEFDHLRLSLLTMAETLRQRQQAAKEQRHQLEQAGAERNRRLAEVSHDLRTPLTSILGYAQLYREEGHPALETVEQEGQALLERVGQWLESCRLESAVLDVRLVSLDLHDLLEEGCHLAGQAAEVELPPKSPVVQADPYLLPRVLSHLLRDLNCAKVQLRLEWPRLQVVGQLPRPERDPSLLSLEGCRQLLEAHGIDWQRQELGFSLDWKQG